MLKCGQRELDLVKNYTGHEYDQVLDQYYAKNRMYDAGDKRFTAVDPVKGSLQNPMSMVQYIYCLNNPVNFVDPLGLAVKILHHTGSSIGNFYGHLDLSVDETVYSFAIYDSSGKFAGNGNIMVVNETNYVNKRMEEGRTVTAYTLNYSDEQEQYLKDTLESYIKDATEMKKAKKSEIEAKYYHGKSELGMDKYNATGYYDGFNCVSFVARALNDTIERLENDDKVAPEKIDVYSTGIVYLPSEVKTALEKAYKVHLEGKKSIVIEREIFVKTKS